MVYHIWTLDHDSVQNVIAKSNLSMELFVITGIMCLINIRSGRWGEIDNLEGTKMDEGNCQCALITYGSTLLNLLRRINAWDMQFLSQNMVSQNYLYVKNDIYNPNLIL